MFYLILLFTLFPSLAWAGGLNIPTIFLTERLMFCSFVLLAGLETWILHKYLPRLTRKQSLIISIKANLLTMFLIVPLIWSIWTGVLLNIPSLENVVNKGFEISNEMLMLITAPWTDVKQSLLVAEWIMAPVYFIASYYGEYLFSRKRLSEYDKKTVKKAFFFANLYSYLMIMFFETIYQVWLFHYKAANPHAWNWW